MAGAVEEHVEGVLEWGVVAAAELVVVGGVLASACGEVRISDQAAGRPPEFDLRPGARLAFRFRRS